MNTEALPEQPTRNGFAISIYLVAFVTGADDPLRDTWLGQLDDLTGRPGVDIGEDAFADLLSQRSLHARSPPCRENTGGEQKGTPPVAGPPDTMIAFRQKALRANAGSDEDGADFARAVCGVLKVIKCKVGDIVGEGVELAVVEPASA